MSLTRRSTRILVVTSLLAAFGIAAAALRDVRAEEPDWTTVARLLQQSYHELKLALATANA
jgi:hypothetical protein